MVSCCFGGSLPRRKDSDQPGEDGFSSAKNIRIFSHEELKAATRNFHPSNKIGRGGFGTVFMVIAWCNCLGCSQPAKGRMFERWKRPPLQRGTLKGGRRVAVKTLSAESRQGIHEFLTEIDTITNVRHANLVELIGCCIGGINRILVYEYLENNSLDQALLGSNDKKIHIDWSQRSAICMGVAQGLAFLHEELDPPIVHRDIKASNVLLDEHLVPKIGDFGLAKLFPDNVTHLSTRVAGTVGYLAPEYAMRGQLTKKADIYSFGVLMLEIVSGRSSAKSTWSGMQKFLLELAWELYEEGKLLELVDPDLGQYPEEEVLRCMKIALFCTQSSDRRRPTMTQVMSMLSKHAQLNEKLLTPPGIIQDMMEIKTHMKAKKTSNSQTPPSSLDQNSAFQSTEPLSTAPFTATEMIPR